jgi:hypothetical protein
MRGIHFQFAINKTLEQLLPSFNYGSWKWLHSRKQVYYGVRLPIILKLGRQLQPLPK